MDLDTLVKKLLKNGKGKLLLLAVAHMENEGLMYLDEFKDDEMTKGEYGVLHFFAEQGILSENHSTSVKGGEYSVFRITDQGKEYFRKSKLRA